MNEFLMRRLIGRTIERCRSVALRALAIVCIAAFGMMDGCNYVTPIAYIVGGPPHEDALYTLADVPTVVYIDDRQNVVNPVSLRRAIADSAGENLMDHNCVKTTISGQDAMTIVAQNERNSKIMSIEDIGKAVGAKQVVYVEMQVFSDTPDGVTPRPTAQCQVRVIDVDARERVFPAEDAPEKTHGVQASLQIVDIEQLKNPSTRLQLMQSLGKETGLSIAKLFYKHEARQLGGNLNPR